LLNLHGFDVEVLEPSTLADPSGKPVLELLLINHRPPLDPVTGAVLDATKVGANSTIELFETVLGETTMRHVKTWADPVIETPNNVAWVGGRNFVFTNDRSQKTGFVSPPFVIY
jgi:arylesterase / paraoxonase